MLRRHSPEKNFPPVACDDGLIFLEDTEKRSYIGATFIGAPAIGVNETVFAQIKAVVGANYPGHTFVQFLQLSIPDIDDYVSAWKLPKVEACYTSPNIVEEQRKLLLETVRTQEDFYLDGKIHPHIRSIGMCLHKVVQIATIKIPVAAQPSDEDIKSARDLIEKFEQGLHTAGLYLHRSDAGHYLWLLRTCFNPYSTERPWYDENRELRSQVLPPGFTIDYTRTDEMTFDDVHVRMLSPRRMPNMMQMGLMDLMQGEPAGINNQLPIPWLLSFSIHLPDRIKKKNWLDQKFKMLTFQASQGNVAKWVPRLAEKKHDIDTIKQDLDQGEMPCEITFSMTLFSKDRAQLNRVSSQISTYLSGYQMDMIEDREILWPLFWNSLPLFPSDTSIINLNRYWSMSLRQGLQFMPITSEWGGTRQGATMLMETRRGQPFTFDLYDSSTNYNALLFAQSGAGKSVFLNYLAANYLAEGARIWIGDIGRSYYKLCKAFGGEYWEFTENSNICLNPFTKVVDLDDEIDMLVALLSKMAAPNDGLDDYGRARLQEAIKAVWSNKGNAMSVTDVAQYMDRQSDEDMVRVAKMLYPFTIHGQFGIWFEGENNLNFASNLIVLELEELEQKPVLQQIVLMILMSSIQHDMYLQQGKGKQLAIFDEAWALFSDPGVAKFLNHAYRRFRKYSGSCIVAVQDIADFYTHPGMTSVAANAATKIIMNQLPESIDRAVSSGHLTLDPYGISQLKTVHTAQGAYSEIMFLSGGAWSVARLVMPDFLKVLSSTKGDARNLIIKAIEEGMPAHDAINLYLQQRGAE